MIHIDKNTVQETLIIPLYARRLCAEVYPDMLYDAEAERLIANLDYDFSEKGKLMHTKAGLFGALEVAQRHYDITCEVESYLAAHPEACVVNLGCGLDTTFRRVDNGHCTGYNLDLPDVINVRNALLPAGEREYNIACDLNDFSWMQRIVLMSKKARCFLLPVCFIISRPNRLWRCFLRWRKPFQAVKLSLTPVIRSALR